MDNKRFVSIELIRQVCPVGTRYDDFTFFLLGSFDAMSVSVGDNIQELKKIYEDRQSSIPAVFDRQPLFLYSKDPENNPDDEESIFCRTGEYMSRPLIITLFQMDKICLAHEQAISHPDQLIEKFEEMLKGNQFFDQNIRFRVFWNLGESDIAVVLRPESLRNLAAALHSFRTGNCHHSHSLKVVSTSSHCAFPKPDELHLSSNRELLRNSLKKWVEKEFSAADTKFITLGNTPSGNPQYGDIRFLFGEWDYMLLFEPDQKENLIDYLIHTFSQLTDSSLKPECPVPFNISYTIPALKVEAGETADPGEDYSGWDNTPYDAMNVLCDAIDRVFVSKERGDELKKSVLSFRNTLTGMSKFLYRLRKGRYEEDLYVYIQPVFERLRDITENYTENITYLCEADREDYADRLICEYIDDISRLIEHLQHLFSIMAVSPHTYLETYGSNMRSLSASDKLLDAYQGIICFLKNNFPDRIDGKPTKREILIFPYRKKQSRHTLLFKNSDPMNRISYISLDFTKMFSLKATIFMLLHECGHHLGDRLRKERFIYFTKAAVCISLGWNIGDYITNPLLTLISRAYSPELSEEWKYKKLRTLFAGLQKDKAEQLYQKYSEWISRIVREEISAAGQRAEEKILEGYGEYIQESDITFPSSVLFTDYFSEQVIVYLTVKYLPAYFGCLSDAEMTEELAVKNQKARLELEEKTFRTIGTKLYDAAGQMASEIAEGGGNLREALRIKTVFSKADFFARDELTYSMFILSSKLQDGVLDELYDIFSNIYSDIFAISLLDISWQDYAMIIPAILGVNKTDIIGHEANLIRTFAVLKTLWPDANVDQAASLLDQEHSEDIIEIWKEIENHPALESMLNYASACRDRMNELIQEASAADPESSKMLRKLFHEDDGTAQIEGIYHFYSYLMKSAERKAYGQKG